MELFGSCQALITGLVESLGMLRASKGRRRLSCWLPHFLCSLPSHDSPWLPPPWSTNSLEFPAYLFLLPQTRNSRHLWQRHFRSPIGSPNPRIYKVPSYPCVCVGVCVCACYSNPSGPCKQFLFGTPTMWQTVNLCRSRWVLRT